MSAPPEQQPCFPDKPSSPCCGIAKKNSDPNDICTASGLCYIQAEPYTGQILQNTCTDWQSPECLDICPQEMKPNHGIHILPCPDISNKHWCCSVSGANCCRDAFEVDIGALLLPSSNSSSPSSSPSRSAPITPSPSSSITLFTASNGAVTTITSMPENNNGNPALNDQCPPDSKANAVTVGVGSGLGACVFSMLIAIWLQRRAYRRKLFRMEESVKESRQATSLTTSAPHPYERVMYAQPAELPFNSIVHEIGSGRK
ncbi:hypothetical protein AJ79_03541 [Helicocarpus griseus UAMH5409]|uniref:Mid2 domain-containing protein n=1 Tax=Helicocarpus griseus UAMH5409 TaxID=1447875 RepID=A0A2B7XXD5_9EURO|nr:hypothetical protein AJ79_03541 [Helicocarpus griseus UAMH5409]